MHFQLFRVVASSRYVTLSNSSSLAKGIRVCYATKIGGNIAFQGPEERDMLTWREMRRYVNDGVESRFGDLTLENRML
ncbi:hypothetical protein M378DRAFT_167907 [Amanita muscaria Koide BX008]|uniref:Uncharacterized protein n=1 Tax=Amanita muscaria (strain Koide BX008) TaxID=946122 RepID=A0A0C2T2H6_AMAMK|nr:hypothetical protein M378DRAFT_167907 [Amanita muscaria Koide BX008]